VRRLLPVRRLLAAPTVLAMLAGGLSTADVAGPGAPAAAAATYKSAAAGPLAAASGSVSSSFSAVDAVSANDGWAVGSHTNASGRSSALIEHWDGSIWTEVPGASTSAATNAQLSSVTGTSARNAWAVGSQTSPNTGIVTTLVEHWDGSAWTVASAPSPGGMASLSSVHAVSANDVWAVGSQRNSSGTKSSLIEHFDGRSWTEVAGVFRSLLTNIQLSSVTGTSATNAWAVGSQTSPNTGIVTTLVEHWDGFGWTLATAPSPGGNASLSSVTATSATDALAVGKQVTPTGTFTLAEHWDGRSWTQATAPSLGAGSQLLSVAATSATNAWAVGFTPAVSGVAPLVEHWDGSSWAVSTSVPGGYQLTSVTATSGGDAWEVGSTGAPALTVAGHWNGTRWTIVPSPGTFSELFKVAASSARNAWAVGDDIDNDNGTRSVLIERWDGISWSVIPSPALTGFASGSVDSVATTSPTDAWVVGLLETASGPSPFIEHWDGSAWTVSPSPQFFGPLESVTATSATDAWAVGYSENPDTPVIEHWDGRFWTTEPTNAPSGPGISGRLIGVTATSATDAWAVGSMRHADGTNGNFIEHWDGSSWEPVPSPDAFPAGDVLTGVSAASAGSALAVGINGEGGNDQTIGERLDGSSWTVAPTPGLSAVFRMPVAATSASNAWAAGSTFSGGVDQATIKRWSGSAWTLAPSPALAFSSALFGVAATSGSDAWAVGEAGTGHGSGTLIEHWDGSAWQLVPSP
jgi:hypothetical protein